MTELKPCPFCGGCGHVYEDGRLSIKPYNFPKWYITCKKCGVKTPTAKIEQVVRIWNRRVNDDAMDMAIEALKCSETPKSSEQNAETAQADHIADTGRKVEQTGETAQNVQNEDLILRKAAIESIRECAEVAHDNREWGMEQGYLNAIECVEEEPPAQPEIIRCKDCKHWRFDHTCREHSLVSPMMANEFCSRAERREG